MPPETDMARIPFEEFLRICTDSGLIAEDTSRLIHNFARALGGVGSVPRVSGAQSEKLQSFETILSFDYPENLTFDNYVTTEENYYTCEILRTVAFIPRIWKAIAPVFIHAPTGQGKTHLLAATKNATSRKALLINTLDLETEHQHARSAGRERELRDWMIQHDLILIDDIQFARGNHGFEKFIISVMNRMPRESHGLVISSDVEPSKLSGLDASLLSRLMSGITIKLEIVNKKGRKEILEQFFNYTGMNLSDEVVDYLADTFTSNVRQLKAAARMVLARVLGTGTAMTVESTRTLLGFMTEGIKTESFTEEELLSADTDRSEYIVVEVEEEPDKKRRGSGKQPFVIEPVRPETRRAMPDVPVPIEEAPAPRAARESVPQTAARKAPAVVPTPVREPEERPVAASPRSGRKSASKYREMLASADTVEKQTEALRMAVSERIRQLTESGADNIEIGRLQVTLKFLERGDLESAMLSLKA